MPVGKTDMIVLLGLQHSRASRLGSLQVMSLARSFHTLPCVKQAKRLQRKSDEMYYKPGPNLQKHALEVKQLGEKV